MYTWRKKDPQNSRKKLLLIFSWSKFSYVYVEQKRSSKFRKKTYTNFFLVKILLCIRGTKRTSKFWGKISISFFPEF